MEAIVFGPLVKISEWDSLIPSSSPGRHPSSLTALSLTWNNPLTGMEPAVLKPGFCVDDIVHLVNTTRYPGLVMVPGVVCTKVLAFCFLFECKFPANNSIGRILCSISCEGRIGLTFEFINFAVPWFTFFCSTITLLSFTPGLKSYILITKQGGKTCDHSEDIS